VSVYIGPWQWDGKGSVPSWVPPLGCSSAVDLRPLPEQSAIGGTPGVGVFVTDAALPSEYVLLGDHPTAHAPARIRSAWGSLTGYEAQGARVVDLLWDQLTRGSDPDGDTAPKPLMPGKQGRGHWTDLHLGGRHKSRPFVWGEDAETTERVRDLLRRDFRRTFAEAQAGKLKDKQHHRRVLDYWCEQYGVDDWREFVAADLRADIKGRLKHETTLTDNFNRANASSPGSSSEGWSWTDVTNSTAIESNRLRVDSGADGNAARAESDLSSADHYSQHLVVFLNPGKGSGALTRFSSSATTFYMFYSDSGRLFKCVAGAFTTLSTSSSHAVTFTVKCQINGSALAGFYDGVQQTTATDTAITGNLRTGLRLDFAGLADDFEAADLSAGGFVYTQLERGTRGLTRGVYVWH